MNGNRLNQIHTLGSNASPFLTTAASHAGSYIQGLDYYGRRMCQSGGGFLELIPRRHARLTLCMGATRGHEPDSVPMASGIETIVRSLSADADARPASIVHALNRFVHSGSGDATYASLFYASVDPVRRELRYINAGHEPALLLRKRHDRAIRLENNGAVLGLTLRCGYGERAIPLEPGDLLAAFSEGVAETTDIHGRPFGAAGVLGVLRRCGCARSAQVAEEILEAAERYAGWSAQPKDRAVAVVRFNAIMAESIPAEAEAELSFAAA